MSAVFSSQALLDIARMMSQQSGINLVIDPQAKTFSAKPGVLIMPPLAVIAERFPQAADLETYVIGAVYHETGHLLHTDYSLRAAFRDLYRGHQEYDLANGVGQVVEDVVIERAQCQRFGGAGPGLTRMWHLLYQKMGVHDVHEMEPLRKAFGWIFHAARNSVLGQSWTSHLAQEYKTAVGAEFPADMVTDIEEELIKLDFAGSTADGFAIAVRLLAILGINPSAAVDAEEAEAGKDGEGQSVTASQGEPADQQEGSEPADADQSNVAGQGKATGGEGQPEAAEQGQQAAAEASGDAPSGEQPDRDGGEGIAGAGQEDAEPQGASDNSAGGESSAQQEVSDATDAADAESGEGETDETTAMIAVAMQELADSLPEPPQMAVYFGVAGGKGLASDTRQQAAVTDGMRLRESIARNTMYAAERLSSVLKAQTEAHTEYGRKGKLVAARAWKLQAGNVNIFRKTVEGMEYSTAVKVLLDRSSSMSGQMRTAIEAAAFLAMTLETIDGLHCSLDMFPGGRNYSESVKRFDERTQSCLDRMAKVTANGGTPMLEAIQLSCGDLMDFEADRRILVVATDGEPYEKEVVKKLVRQLQREGVEVIGIGIGSNTRASMRTVFDDYCVIGGVSELADELAKVMETKLLAAQNVA